MGFLGHHPEETITRRFHAGIQNFFQLYKPLTTSWRFYDNSDPAGPRLLATGGKGLNEDVHDLNTWNHLKGEYDG